MTSSSPEELALITEVAHGGAAVATADTAIEVTQYCDMVKMSDGGECARMVISAVR